MENCPNEGRILTVLGKRQGNLSESGDDSDKNSRPRRKIVQKREEF